MIKFEKNRNLDLICLGRAGVDLNPAEFNHHMEDVSSYNISLGGSPANIAVGTAKLGLKTGFIGRVSDDPLGHYVMREMGRNSIDTTELKYTKGALTSLAITEVRSPSDCSVLFYRENAADLHLCCDDISENYIGSAKALLISGTALSQSPSREAAYLAADYARKNGTAVIFEVDYRSANWKYMEETSLCYQQMCRKSDIIIGTRDEFDVVEYFSDRENHDDRVTANFWLEKNAQLVVIKRGEKGFTVFGRKDLIKTMGPYPAHVTKTFGAGDAMASAFTAAILKEKSLDIAMEYGAISAAITIGGTDCTKSLPTEQEILDYKEKHPHHNI